MLPVRATLPRRRAAHHAARIPLEEQWPRAECMLDQSLPSAGSSLVHTVVIPTDVAPVAILGPADDVVRTLEEHYPDVDILPRGNQIRLRGPAAAVDALGQLFGQLFDAARRGERLDASAVSHAVDIMRASGFGADQVVGESITSHRGKTVRAKTAQQQVYVDAIDRSIIVFGLGPAGTGKTYLAMAKAIDALHARQVSRIILTRPAVEAGERLGFLPGGLHEKIDPYLRPLLDALADIMGTDAVPKLMESGVIEVAPLAFMRGRTLNDAFVILDEAQNTSNEQMKMFLTRLGFGSKMVITGDATQIDLPRGTQSGLHTATKILTDVDDVAVIELTTDDVVRHRLVGDIVAAYDRADQPQDQQSSAKDPKKPAEKPTSNVAPQATRPSGQS